MSCLLTLPFVLWTHTNYQRRKEQLKKSGPGICLNALQKVNESTFVLRYLKTVFFYLYIYLLPVFCQLNWVIKCESVIFERA